MDRSDSGDATFKASHEEKRTESSPLVKRTAVCCRCSRTDVARSLRCGHFLCSLCVQHIEKQACMRTRVYLCPLCPEGGQLRLLHRDLTRLGSILRPKWKICQTCLTNETKTYCEMTAQYICENCASKSGRLKEHLMPYLVGTFQLETGRLFCCRRTAHGKGIYCYFHDKLSCVDCAEKDHIECTTFKILDPMQNIAEYKMDHPNRGKAIIFHVEKFYNRRLSERKGNSKDVAAVQECLTNIGFQVESFENDQCTHQNINTILKRASATTYKDSDCFLCMFLSHGEKDLVCGYDEDIPISELTSPFNGNNCPSLIGKPKLFFIQACRGQRKDTGAVQDTVFCVEQPDSVPLSQPIKRPSEADFLIAYATVEGYVSWRNEGDGTWFIQSLTSALNEYRNSLDLITILTKVCAIVADREAKEQKYKQVPCIQSTLTKQVYF